MKRMILIFALPCFLLIVAVSGYVLYTKSCVMVHSESASMELSDTEFKPAVLTIKRCTKVSFRNTGTSLHWPASDLHPIHLAYPEFDPQEPLDTEAVWDFVFDRRGKWKCHDHLNPHARCSIEVQ